MLSSRNVSYHALQGLTRGSGMSHDSLTGRGEGLYSTLVRKWQAQVTRLQDDLADSRRINDEQVKLIALLGELSNSAVRHDGASS